MARPEMGIIEPRAARSTPRGRHTAVGRLAGAVGLVALTAVLFWLLTDDAYRVTEASVRFEGLRHADEAEVRARLQDLERSPNAFRVRASEIVEELSVLPEVDAAYATVVLPDTITVTLDERDPIFVWSDGAVSWLVDEEGMLFAPRKNTDGPTDAGEPGASDGAPDTGDPLVTGADEVAGTEALTVDPRAGLPVVHDARLSPPDAAPAVGRHLSSIDLDVMRQLLALTPELLGSSSASLHLRIDEADGYVLMSRDLAWTAQFGHYTPSLQPPEVVARQVQCLRSLLAKEESDLVGVRLALSERACGTYTSVRKEADRRGATTRGRASP